MPKTCVSGLVCGSSRCDNNRRHDEGECATSTTTTTTTTTTTASTTTTTTTTTDFRQCRVVCEQLRVRGHSVQASPHCSCQVGYPLTPNTMTTLEILSYSDDPEQMCQPCVDCSLYTGCYCDYCYGVERLPNSHWAPGQHTPLCSRCDSLRGACHYCLGVQWCSPAPHGRPPQAATPATPSNMAP